MSASSSSALRLELEPEGWRVVQGRCFDWPHTAATPGIAAILPRMQTDIEVSHAGLARRIVIDTKFTTIFTSSLYREELLKSVTGRSGPVDQATFAVA